MVLLNGPASPVLMTIDLLHLPGAHTDGDAIVHVDSADVIQAGDVWFTRKRLSSLKRQGSSAEQAVAAQPQVDPEEGCFSIGRELWLHSGC